jgi:hypothetical protein
MFNLDQSISAWRSQMLAAGVQSPVPLDELESHLREDIAQQMQSGLDAQAAFAIAVGRIGQATALKKEFAKNGRKSVFLRLLKGFLFRTGEIPIPPPADFTPAAREALEFAPVEALGFHHDFIGTEHVLLAISRSSSGIVSAVMQNLGLSSDVIRTEIEEFVHSGPPNHPLPGTIPFTPRARKALQLAAKEAQLLKQPHINAEHIFLGLILEGGGVAALILKKLGIRPEKAREEVLRQIRAVG